MRALAKKVKYLLLAGVFMASLGAVAPTTPTAEAFFFKRVSIKRVIKAKHQKKRKFFRFVRRLIRRIASPHL